jgi:hypothetical protein
MEYEWQVRDDCTADEEPHVQLTANVLVRWSDVKEVVLAGGGEAVMLAC